VGRGLVGALLVRVALGLPGRRRGRRPGRVGVARRGVPVTRHALAALWPGWTGVDESGWGWDCTCGATGTAPDQRRARQGWHDHVAEEAGS